jgi:hypothetical protein
MVSVFRSVHFKWPAGFHAGMRVMANGRHAKAHKTTSPGRRGTVIRPMEKRGFVLVHWDGLVHPCEEHLNFLERAR